MADSSAEGDTTTPVNAVIQVSGVSPGRDNATLSLITKHCNDKIDSFEETNISAGGTHIISVDAVLQVGVGAPSHVVVGVNTINDSDMTEGVKKTDSSTGGTHGTPVDAVIQVNMGAPSHEDADTPATLMFLLIMAW